MGRLFRPSLVVIILSLSILPLGSLRTGAQSNSGIQLAVDTKNFVQDGLLAIFGGVRFGGDLGLPVGAGDINGDGRADVIFCQMYATAGLGGRQNNGQVNFYISDGRDTGFIDAAQPQPNIFTLVGADAGDLLGTSVATGDVNGDGLREVALGAFGDDGPNNSRFNAGAVYVVPGSRDFNLRADLQTGTDTPPAGIIAIYGGAPNRRTGIWVDMGDIDGDGFADIVMGADQINTGAGQHAGGACVIFGSPTLPQVIDLASPPPGVRMMAILGSGQEDHWGSALHVGDLNSDGLADISIAGAIFRDSASYVTPADQNSGHDARAANFGGTRPGAGELYVIYGSRDMPQLVDLRNPPAGSTHVIGAERGDFLGSQIHSADINGDGRRELIIGALQAQAPDNRGRTGAVYVVYGSPQLVGATIDLSNPNASGLYVSTIYGENHLDCGGDSVRSFDINKDGLSDLFIGSPEHTLRPQDVGEERDDAGDTKFFFGQQQFLPQVIKLYDPPAVPRIFRLAGPEGRQQGLDGGDEMSYRLAGGDVDGDGFVDYIANAMHGDGLDNRLTNTGELYIFSGKKLSARLGMLKDDPGPTPAPTLESTSLSVGDRVVQQANAGQSGVRITINGSGFNSSTEVLINGRVVVARLPADPQLQSTQRIVELDDNPEIRNTVGPLIVRVRNLNPPSEFTSEFSAGRLIGPEISAIRPKRKGSGLLLLRIDGSNFDSGSTVTVLTATGQPVPIKKVSFNSSTSITVKIRASAAPPPGTLLRVRVVTPSGVQSNEATTTL